MIVRSRLVRAGAALLLAVGMAAALPQSTPAAPAIKVTYVYLDYCGSCRLLRQALGEFPARYGPGVSVDLMPHVLPAAQAAVAAHGFDSHGLTIHVDGQLRFKAADHRIRLADVEHAVERALSDRPPIERPSKRMDEQAPSTGNRRDAADAGGPDLAATRPWTTDAQEAL